MPKVEAGPELKQTKTKRAQMERNALRESEVKDWPEGRPRGFEQQVRQRVEYEIWNILYIHFTTGHGWKKYRRTGSTLQKGPFVWSLVAPQFWPTHNCFLNILSTFKWNVCNIWSWLLLVQTRPPTEQSGTRLKLKPAKWFFYQKVLGCSRILHRLGVLGFNELQSRAGRIEDQLRIIGNIDVGGGDSLNPDPMLDYSSLACCSQPQIMQ